MGLDMYLNTSSQGLAKHMYDWHVEHGYWEDEYNRWRLPSGIIGYWRKANQIHRWMVDNVQYGRDDCNPYEMSTDKMEKLVEACRRVLDIRDSEVSDVLLPTTSGFFFGSTDYDEYYYDDVEYTKALFEEILKNLVHEKPDYTYIGYDKYVGDEDWDANITYRSSW